MTSYIFRAAGLGLAMFVLFTSGRLLADPAAADMAQPAKESAPKQIDVTADQSLEWYQDQNLYVARGNAKAIRGDSVIEADLLTAHERDQSKAAEGTPKKTAKPPKAAKDGKNDNSTSNVDKMTAEGHVRITDPRQQVMGEHAVYDLDKHVVVVTGDHLKYETEKETVTARDSLEYWEEKKIAVARGNAVAESKDRHVEGDVLTAEFRDTPAGAQEMWKMTAEGHVTVVTATDVTRGDRGVYDVSRDIAVVSGNVRITRNDGTQLTGDVGEVDFKTNQSRLLNESHTRVHALLVSKSNDSAKPAPATLPQPEGTAP